MGTLADRIFEMTLRNRVLFGVGEIGRLPEVVTAAGGSRVFVVTDPGVRAAGIVEPVLDALGVAGLPTAIFDEIEPNPAAATVERGARVSARTMPHCSNSASTATSRLASDAEWLDAARTPAAERPDLTAMIGFRRATSGAMRANLRGFPKLSR